MRTFIIETLFDGAQWLHDAVISVDDLGHVVDLSSDARAEWGSELHRIGGTVVPAQVNLHSHAFQREMAGRAEVRGPDVRDSFWTWRQSMYQLAGQLEPDGLCDGATRLYRQLRARGFGSVVEFHYVHHRPDGAPYAAPSAMADALIRAAEDAGIVLTLLPVLYQRRGFLGDAPLPEQARFCLSTDAYLRALEDLQSKLRGSRHRVGVAFHSLRAVSLEAIRSVLAFRQSWDPESPVHIHVAEQEAEVEQCLDAHGARPIQLLAAEVDLDPRWCLVHATHATPDELRSVASSGAVVGLCPSTEANLGDGLFDLPDFLEAGGRWGIGTDSHVTLCPFEELRWLEYGQRLATKARLVVDGPTRHVGTNLWMRALDGGRRAAGHPPGGLVPGAPADWVILPEELDGVPLENRLDVAIFGRDRLQLETWVGGQPPSSA